jgi:ABC-type transport system substrate-binding protein
MGLPPTDDVRIRKAMIKAVDREAVNNSIYLNTLKYHKAFMYDPESSPYGADLSDLWDGEFRYDLDEAKALVEEYAQEKGLSLPVTVKGVCERRPDRQLFCEYLQATWELVGLKFEFPIVATVGDASRVMDECQTNLQQVGSGVNPIAGPQLDGLTRNRSFQICADSHNGDQSVNDRMKALLDEATQSIDPAVHAEKWQEVQRIALEEGSWGSFPALLRVNYVGCHAPTTGGCDQNPMYGHGFWQTQDMWLKR